MKDVFPQRLKSARIRSGLSMQGLADKLEGRLSYNAIYKYEKGNMLPDSAKLVALAKALGVKVDYFFRPFRFDVRDITFREPSRLGKKREKALQEEIRDKVERYLEVEDFLGIGSSFLHPIAKRVRCAEEVEGRAETLRRNWHLGTQAIHSVVGTLEDRRIKVLGISEADDFSGISGWVNGSIPVLILNDKASNVSKRFSALYELGKLLIKFDEKVSSSSQDKLCGRFARAMLMPRATFFQEVGRHRKRLSLAELLAIKQAYGIPVSSLLDRATELEVISKSTGVSLKKALKKWKPEKNLGAYHVEESSNRFNQLVYRAVAEGLISTNQGANLSNQKVAEFRENYGWD